MFPPRFTEKTKSPAVHAGAGVWGFSSFNMTFLSAFLSRKYLDPQIFAPGANVSNGNYMYSFIEMETTFYSGAIRYLKVLGKSSSRKLLDGGE